jgi:hypothetical protein
MDWSLIKQRKVRRSYYEQKKQLQVLFKNLRYLQLFSISSTDFLT